MESESGDSFPNRRGGWQQFCLFAPLSELLRELRDRLRDSRVRFDPAPGGHKHFLRAGVEVRVIKAVEYAKHSGSQVDSIGEKCSLAQSTRRWLPLTPSRDTTQG